MLRQLLRVYSSNIANTMKFLQLKPQEDAPAKPEPPGESLPPPKKKVKISLKRSELSNFKEKALSTFLSLPETSHHIPESIKQTDKEWDGITQILEEQAQKVKQHMEDLRNVPREGKHYYTSSVADYPSGKMHSMKVRLYIANMMRQKRFEGTTAGYDYLPPEQFEKLDDKEFKFYPGAQLGEESEIDKGHWATWYLKNQPKEIKNLASDDWEPMEGDIDRLSDMENELNADTIMGKRKRATFESSGPGASDNKGSSKQGKVYRKNEYLQMSAIDGFLERDHNIVEDLQTNPIQELILRKDINNVTMYTGLEEPDLLPGTPPTLPLTLVGFSREIQAWSVFRNIPYYLKGVREMQRIDETSPEDTPWKPVRIPSILNYYQTLPKYYQIHPVIIGLTQILEKCHPLITRKKKELMLNQMCNLITPRNPKKYLFLQEYFPISEEDLNKIYADIDPNINPDINPDDPDAEFQLELQREQEMKEKEMKRRQKKLEQEALEEEQAKEEESDDAKKPKKGEKNKKEKKNKKGKKAKEEQEEEENSEQEASDEDQFERKKEVTETETGLSSSSEEEVPDIKNYGKKIIELTPEQQLTVMLGEEIEEIEDDYQEFDIPDRKIDWFTSPYENSDGYIPSPITFYDNKDGFWDHWIKIKRQRSGLPEINARTYLKH